MDRIAPGGQPFTVAEAREYVATLIREYQGEPGVELLGLVGGVLDNVACNCHPAETGPLAEVLPLRPRTRD
ncbi:hypothetical protein [Amycolatopsis sp. NPDC004378]